MRLSRDGFSIDAAIEKGRPLPDWYLDEPPIIPSDSFYLDAFDSLSTTRQMGMSGPGPIPWNQVLAFATDVGFDEEMIVIFKDVIKSMDIAYLNWAAESSKRHSKSQK